MAHLSLRYRLGLHNNSWHARGPGYMFVEKNKKQSTWMSEYRYIIVCVFILLLKDQMLLL